MEIDANKWVKEKRVEKWREYAIRISLGESEGQNWGVELWREGFYNFFTIKSIKPYAMNAKMN